MQTSCYVMLNEHTYRWVQSFTQGYIWIS